jgi:hypothetical protein
VKYADGQDVRLGDRVRLGDDDGGRVVCSVNTSQYSEECPESEWSYLKTGVLISFPRLGLIHYVEPEEDLQLIERGGGEL